MLGRGNRTRGGDAGRSRCSEIMDRFGEVDHGRYGVRVEVSQNGEDPHTTVRLSSSGVGVERHDADSLNDLLIHDEGEPNEEQQDHREHDPE